MSEKKSKTPMSKKEKAAFIINVALLTLLAASFVYSFIMIFVTPVSSQEATKSDYILKCLQSLLGVALLSLPYILSHKFRLDIPLFLKLILVVYIYISIFLGEIQNFYYKFAHWDTICHVTSGMIFALLSFSFIYLMNSSQKIHLNLKPGFIALFSFCFAVTSGAVWEVFEFTIDSLFGCNMQKFIPEITELFNGGAGDMPLLGTDAQIAEFFRSPAGYKYALMDTMYDMVVDIIGSFVMSMALYLVLKYKKEAFYSLVIRRRSKETSCGAEENEKNDEMGMGQVVVADSPRSASEQIAESEVASTIPPDEMVNKSEETTSPGGETTKSEETDSPGDKNN